MISLRLLTKADLPFVWELRHHPLTLKYLHDQSSFSLKEVDQWFRTTKPQWYIIESDKRPVGYIRTSDHDDLNLNLKIGADIHPLFRRRGYAQAAYELLLERLYLAGWNRVWLEVLPSNQAAIALYLKLGFQHEGRMIGSVRRGSTREDSLVMGRSLDGTTGRNAKVIAVYLGPRRKFPTNSRDGYHLLAYLLEQELSLDPGCPCDTILVHNRDPANLLYQSDPWVRRSEALLASVHGQATPRGQIRLITRENIGISFGAYHHAFAVHRREYDYWMFTEDDQVLVRTGYFGQAIQQLQADPQVGFVAIVGCSRDRGFPPHAHGGVGISSRPVLRHVMRANPCKRHPEGHLPYHWEKGYRKQELLGEVRFTHAIHLLGYSLVNHDWDEICVSWGHTNRRTSRMVAWNVNLCHNHRFGE